MSKQLYNCPDCGKEVSYNAKVCPHCGNNKLEKQLHKQEWDSLNPSQKRVFIIIGTGVFLAVYLFIADFNAPDPCDCVDILDIPTQKVGIGMPIPVEHLSNEDFRDYSDCYEEYHGPYSALLECTDK